MKARPLRPKHLVVSIAVVHMSCAYGFSGDAIPRLAPPESASEPIGSASYSIKVRDTKFAQHARAELALENALLRTLTETGLFSEVVRNDSERIVLLGNDVHLDVEVIIDQSGSSLPQRILTILTAAVIPSWGHVRSTARVVARSPERVGGPYVIEDDQTIVLWLPLALVMIPDVYWGAHTGEGNYMERAHRNLFRNVWAAVRCDGFLPADVGRPTSGCS